MENKFAEESDTEPEVIAECEENHENLSVESGDAHKSTVDASSVQHAVESWNKSRKKKKKTYFDMERIQNDVTSVQNSKESWEKKTNRKKASF